MRYTGKFAVLTVLESKDTIEFVMRLFNSLMAQKTPNWLWMVSFTGSMKSFDAKVVKYIEHLKSEYPEFVYFCPLSGTDTPVLGMVNFMVDKAQQADMDNYCLASARCFFAENFLTTMERKLRSGFDFESEPRVAMADFALISSGKMASSGVLEDLKFQAPSSSSKMFKALVSQNLMFRFGICFNKVAAALSFPAPESVSDVAWWVSLCSAGASGNFSWSGEVLRSYTEQGEENLIKNCLSPDGKTLFPMLRSLQEHFSEKVSRGGIAVSSSELNGLLQASASKSSLGRFLGLFRLGVRPHCQTGMFGYYTRLSGITS